MTSRSFVSLVGAGPGDPELLTLGALRRLQQAEVVVHDRLVSPAILELVPPTARLIDVGKAPRCHRLTQAEINALLVRLGRSGRRIVRLKGGDPYVFGRGSEEALELAARGIDFEVIPGITAAAGCLAAAGIPMTHRGLATGVHLITGHCRDELAIEELPWSSLADSGTTVVLYMALTNLETICARLLAAGRPANTPAAAIAGGTTPNQRICRARLCELAQSVARAGLAPPVLVVVGDVVSLADRLVRNGSARIQAEDGHALACAG